MLLLVTFRSIVVPIKAILLNLLSVGAAYGALVLVFQDGHGEKLLDFQSVGGIASWIPLFLFVILFGLSMDYHVFILSRVREAVDRGMPHRRGRRARHQDHRGRRHQRRRSSWSPCSASSPLQLDQEMKQIGRRPRAPRS